MLEMIIILVIFNHVHPRVWDSQTVRPPVVTDFGQNSSPRWRFETLKIGYKASKPISDVHILHSMTTIDTMPESVCIVGPDFG